MKRKMLVLTAVVLLGLLCGAVAQAGIEISTAIGNGADTYITNDNEKTSTGPTVTHGTEAMMKVRYLPQPATANRVKMGIIRFDLSGLSGSLDGLDGATLEMQVYYAKGTAKKIDVYGLTDETLDSWSETATCYNNAPAFIANPPTLLGDYALDMTKVVKLGFVTTATSTVVFSSNTTDLPLGDFLRSDTNKQLTFLLIAQGNSEYQFAAKESGSSYLAPTLVLPEPATMLLLGLGGLLLRKRS